MPLGVRNQRAVQGREEGGVATPGWPVTGRLQFVTSPKILPGGFHILSRAQADFHTRRLLMKMSFRRQGEETG